MEKKKTEYTIKTSVEVEGLDCAIEKAKRFVALLKKAAEIQAKEGWMMDNKIYFLCDGEKEDCKRTYCYKNTNDEPCKRTADINHAKNFEKMPHGGYREKEDGKTWEEEIEEKERGRKPERNTPTENYG